VGAVGLRHLQETSGRGGDEVVAEGVDERLVAHDACRIEERRGVALRPFLAHVTEVGEPRDLIDGDQRVRLRGAVERLHQLLGRTVEVVLDRPLVVARDDHDVLDACLDKFLDDVLDHRPVHDRQHLFRHRLRLRQKARPEPGRGDDRRANGGPHLTSWCSSLDGVSDTRWSANTAPSSS
jgi:hypothetical protein